MVPTDIHSLFVYRINASDRLIFVNEDWLEFARENQAEGLTRENVLNRSLWDFVTDPETQHIYELVFERVRSGGFGVTLPYRCDSPDRRRFMELEVTPLPAGSLQIVSRLLREEMRETIRLLEPKSVARGEILSMCGWCKRIRVGDNTWLEVEEAVAEMDLFAAPELPRISHITCPSCYEHALAVLRGLEPSQGA